MLKETVSANDKYDGDLLSDVYVDDITNINNQKEGAYKITYIVENSRHQQVKKTVNIYIVGYLPDNQADGGQKYRFIKKDCSEVNDYCLEYFDSDSKWVKDSVLNEQVKESLSKEDGSKAIKKYNFKSSDVKKSKKKQKSN